MDKVVLKKKVKRTQYTPGKRWVERPPFIVDIVRQHQDVINKIRKRAKQK